MWRSPVISLYEGVAIPKKKIDKEDIQQPPICLGMYVFPFASKACVFCCVIFAV
jgi:hypothetical protein